MAIPQWIWAKSAGSSSNDHAGLDYGSSTISTDQYGNSYITGAIGGAATFAGTSGPITVTAATYPAVFVAKFDTDGYCLWALQFGGNDTDTYGNKGESIDIDDKGNCYVTGTFNGALNQDIILRASPLVQLKGTGRRQVFTVKISKNGIPRWAKQPIGNINANHYSKSICVDSKRRNYTTGYLGSSGVVFDATTLNGVGAHVVKRRGNGSVAWAKILENNGAVDGKSIAVSSSFETYVTGYFQGTASFNTSPQTTLTSVGLRNVFLAKFSANGNFLYAKQFSGATSGMDAWGRGISTDMYGNVFVAGFFSDQINFGGGHILNGNSRQGFVAKFDPNGNCVWAQKSSHMTDCNTIKASPFGECYVAGNGAQLACVAKYDINGNELWVQKSTYTNTGENPMGISMDAGQNIYIAGHTQGASIFGAHTVASNGGYDILIAKLEKSCP